ncbi:MAG TPA: hypothetical protein VJK48_03845 [Chlamydiales bacterium]|nr:hypothetical protein [Chlamydiales bacterium]
MTAISSNPFDSWKPQTANTLDLRLAKPTPQLFEKKIQELGKDLTALYTQGCYLSADPLVNLPLFCPNLTIVVLNCANRVADGALKILGALPKLRELNVSDAMDRGPYLEGPFFYITDDGVFALLKRCATLINLDLSKSHITNATLEAIASVPNIKSLKIENCLNLTRDAIDQLKKKRPDLKILEKCDETDASLAFQELAQRVKERYLDKEDTLKTTIPVEEAELISSSILSLIEIPEELAQLFETLNIQDHHKLLVANEK